MRSASSDGRAPVDDEAELASKLVEVIPLVMRAIRFHMRANRALDLSVPQYRALGFVVRHPGASLSQVAEHQGLTLGATSRLVDGLVTRGLVERRASTQDRRFVTLHVLPDGASTLAQARQRTEQALARMLAALPATDHETLLRALESLRAVFAAGSAERPGMQETAHTDGVTDFGQRAGERIEGRE
jgi:DNA-binding MarR family transcriptional regulator